MPTSNCWATMASIPFGVGHLHDRAHLGAEHALGHAPVEQLVEAADRLHQLDAVGLVGQALVDLQERDDTLDLPEVVAGVLALDLAVHGLLEQDRPEHAVAREARAGDDPAAHLVDRGRTSRRRPSTRPRRCRRASAPWACSAALVEGGDEPPDPVTFSSCCWSIVTFPVAVAGQLSPTILTDLALAVPPWGTHRWPVAQHPPHGHGDTTTRTASATAAHQLPILHRVPERSRPATAGVDGLGRSPCGPGSSGWR